MQLQPPRCAARAGVGAGPAADAPVVGLPAAWARPGVAVGAVFDPSRAIVYVHVPKTAGTFMLAALRRVARGRRLAFVHLANASAGYRVRARGPGEEGRAGGLAGA